MRGKSIVVSFIPVYVLLFSISIMIATITSKVIATVSEYTSLNNRYCVIVDPGHGGIDGGATSYSGVLESNLNLQIALRLDDLLHFIGIDTILVRDSDISIHTEGITIAQKKISDLI